ncbi:MAG: M48 family metallopeptidase [Gammaproteobacteria bacterium SHHR-1]|uniref:M48 family metallopeptidase n=1 Tax=Magnetovirga frankeli TaxID=947516 RepID=UPI00129386E9|nr:M48 family metallopeptidase [gamma proteobacterium SS-5]
MNPPPHPVEGQLYANASSAAQPASLSADGPGRVRLRSADGHSSHALSDLQISTRLGNTPRHLGLADGRRFETRDNPGLDRLLRAQRGPPAGHWLHRLESRWGFVALALALSLLLLWGLAVHGLPAAARVVAMQMPMGLTDSLSNQVLKQLDERLLRPSALPQATQTRLRQRLDPILAEQDAFTFELRFRQGGKALGANALALPSGLIIITDELVRLAQDDNELAAVLAHEVGHVVHRHGLRQMVQNAALGLILTYLTGDISSLAGALPLMLLQLGYSREFEYEADRFARDWLSAQGLSPEHLAGMLKRLEGQSKQHKAGGYLSTHPATEERIQRLKTEDRGRRTEDRILHRCATDQ